MSAPIFVLVPVAQVNQKVVLVIKDGSIAMPG